MATDLNRPSLTVEQQDQLIADLVATTIEHVESRLRRPEATYRLQFHRGFTFRQAEAIVPYLAELGITDAYASPYLKAAPGSTHGYDITDHATLNPEVGTEADHEAWLEALRAHGLGLVLDVVPNHMGILGNENEWWNDILENGQSAAHAESFDIDWSAPSRPENVGRVLLPSLGDLYGVVLENGELRLASHEGSFHVEYHEHRFPLDPSSYGTVLAPLLERLEPELGNEHPAVVELQSILTAIRNLPTTRETDPDRRAERTREKEVVKRRLAAVRASAPGFDVALETTLDQLNGTPGDPHSFDELDRLLEAQPYRLAYWRVATDEINYRRFFDINTLAALRMDRAPVFEAAHRRILDLVAQGGAVGLRIDHPDGLLDPLEYLQRLQAGALLHVARRLHETSGLGDFAPWDQLEPRLRNHFERIAAERPNDPRLYVVVEKILGTEENLPHDWPTHGTSGYDVLNEINGLFVDPNAGLDFTRRYLAWIEDDTPLREIVRASKIQILRFSLASELNVLAHQLERIAVRDRRTRDFTRNALRHALREVIASFPVYRSYITPGRVGDDDRAWIERAVRSARRRNPATSRALFRFLRDVLLNPIPTDDPEPDPAVFAGKFQQVTAPVMAKGLEDTSFYIYNRLVSLNEVGGEPGRFGVRPDHLHDWGAERARRHPYGLSALSTHDTKRSEDVRARINVLSEMPEAWFEAATRWARINEPLRTTLDDRPVPDRNEEFFLYQTLLGAFPLEPLDEPGWETFRDRIRAYVAKAAHEAKVHTSWTDPYEEYDQALDSFASRLLDPSANAAFLEDFLPFQRRISHHGWLNSLAQTVLRTTLPGAPDTYQGTELWDFSLVDPDNRRPVDYGRRARLLEELKGRHDSEPDRIAPLVSELLDCWHDGRIKLYTLWRTLAVRRERPGLLSKGDYLPGRPSGSHAESLFGFGRTSDAGAAIVAVPRLTTRLVEAPAVPIGPAIWAGTELVLPDLGTVRFRNIFTGEWVEPERRDGHCVLKADSLFSRFPVAVLLSARP